MRKMNLGEIKRKNVYLQLDIELIRKATEKYLKEGTKSFRELVDKLLRQYVGEESETSKVE